MNDDKQIDWLGSIGAWIGEHWFTILLIVIGAYIARHFAGLLVEAVIRRTVTRRSHGDLSEEDIKKRQDTLISLFTAFVRFMVWMIAIFTLLGMLDLNLMPLLTAAGVVGVAIGFGAQSVIKDFLSGLFIILENQYRVGDFVELDGAQGKVEDVTVRSTVLRDNDGSVHYIPNGSITHTINRTMGYARINLTIAVAPDTDVDKLAEIINRVGEKLAEDEKWKSKILGPPKFQSIENFSNSVMEVKITGKMQPSAQWSVTGELRKRLLAAINKEGIGLAAGAAPAKKK